MVEWPQERRHRLGNVIHIPQRLADIPVSLLHDAEETSAFKTLIQALVDAFNEKVDPKTKLTELSAAIDRPDAFGDYDELLRQAVLALACVATLRKTPTREMWEYLWSLAWHSVSLESFLPQAVIMAASEPVFRDLFFAVARSVVREAAQQPGRRAVQREREIGANLREHWQKNPQLSTLWRGNFERSFHAVGRDDDHVLSIVAEIDAVEFIKLLALFDYPDPVAHALIWCGAPRWLELWKDLASAAPAAFEQDATWNRSLVLPLLLAIARDQFQFGLGREPAPSQVSEATSDIKDLAAEVAKTITRRADARGCMARWGNWLVRTGISAVSTNPLPHPIDAASQGFIESALLDALAVEMPAQSWASEPIPDAETWEPWCQIAAGTLMAHAGQALMPSMEEFLNDWHLGPDDWSTQRGQKLKYSAFPFEGGAPRADSYGARLLALPMVEANHADATWRRFWDATATLREIVEFGYPNEADNSGWEGRADAARLLMLQFSIGLMMMDHLISPPRPLNYDRRVAVERLLILLSDAVRELIAIDQLNGKFWSEAVRHLAIRRTKWLSSGATPDGVTLGAESKPTLADFIRDLAGDTENLLALVYVALQNGIDKAELAAAFVAADVDINAEIALAESLRAISPRAIGLSEPQLDAAREVSRGISPGQFNRALEEIEEK